jgi:hypothetical protein
LPYRDVTRHIKVPPKKSRKQWPYIFRKDAVGRYWRALLPSQLGGEDATVAALNTNVHHFNRQQEITESKQERERKEAIVIWVLEINAGAEFLV